MHYIALAPGGRFWHDAGVAITDPDRIDPRQVQGLKRLKHVLPLLASLHQVGKVGCERDKAGNRELHFDEYVTLVLLWLFNPMLAHARLGAGPAEGRRTGEGE